MSTKILCGKETCEECGKTNFIRTNKRKMKIQTGYFLKCISCGTEKPDNKDDKSGKNQDSK